MKKIISTSLATLMLAGALAACAPAPDQLDPAITLASSDAVSYGEWLDERLETIPDDIVLGVGSNAAYGVDMTEFESDGYILRELNGQVLAFGASADGLDLAVRKYAKSVEKGIAENLDEVYHEGKRIEKLTIGGHDISEFTIVYDNSEKLKTPVNSGYLSGNAEYAAKELIRLVEIATGVTLIRRPEEVSGHMIKIGYITDGSHATNGFTYEVADGNLIINGVSEGNGCANGVYYFLQYECGWDNLLYGDSNLAESDHVDVPEGTSADVTPMFGAYVKPYGTIKYGNFVNERATNYLGVRTKTTHGIHQFIDGLGAGDENPCFTDEVILEEATSNVLKYVQNVESSVGKENFNVKYNFGEIHLGTCDTGIFCLCPNCKRIYSMEGKTHAASYIQWANHIAETLEREGYGGIDLNVFAYSGTKKPPTKTIPHKDLKVTFCTDGHCFTHGLTGDCARANINGLFPPENDKGETSPMMRSYLKGWGEITDDIFVWYYALDNHMNAISPLHTMYDDLKFLQECNVEGLLWQCDYEGLGISRLQYQLIMDMHWNPDMTEEEFELALCETLEDEYGEGWYYIREYLNLWHEAQNRSGYCKNCWGYCIHYSYGNYDWDYYAEHYDTMYEYFEKAIALADSDENVKWLELCSVHMIFQGSLTSYFTAYEEGDEARIDVLRERYDILVQRMYKYGLDPEKVKGQDNWGHSYGLTLEDEMWYGVYYYMTLYRMDGIEDMPEPPEDVLLPI